MYKDYKTIVKFREDGTYTFDSNYPDLLPQHGKTIDMKQVIRVSDVVKVSAINESTGILRQGFFKNGKLHPSPKLPLVKIRLVKDIRPLLPDAMRWFHHLFGDSYIQERAPQYGKDGSVEGYTSRILGTSPNQRINPLVIQSSVKGIKF